MTTCDDVRPLLVAGASLSEAAVLDHLESCEECAARAEASGLLETSFGRGDRELRELLIKTETRISMDATASGWLKSRRTWVRALLAVASGTLIFVYVLMWMRRPDFDAYPRERMLLTIGMMLGLMVASLWMGLRSLGRPPLPTWLQRGLTTVGVVAAFLLAAMPSGYLTPQQFVSMELIDVLGTPCFFLGLLFGVPVYALARVLDRGANPFSAILAALAAGLTGNLVLDVHCPRSDPTHLLFGHFSVVLVFVLAAGSLSWIERRVRRARRV